MATYLLLRASFLNIRLVCHSAAKIVPTTLKRHLDYKGISSASHSNTFWMHERPPSRQNNILLTDPQIFATDLAEFEMRLLINSQTKL